MNDWSNPEPHQPGEPARLVVMISGNGSNLQAILEACPSLHATVVCVVSNKASAYGLERARLAGVAGIAKPRQAGQDRRAYDAELADLVDSYSPDWIVLAGWMRVLSREFLDRFPGRVINLHPALPGAFPGTDAIERAFAAYQRGEITQTGVMVHLVPDEGIDSGPVLGQEVVPILPTDSLETLTSRVHAVEHRLLVDTLHKLIHGSIPTQIPVHAEDLATQTAAYLKRIRQVFAQIAPDHSIRSYTINRDGLANHIVIVNGKHVFRFALGEYGRKAMQSEQYVLRVIQGKLPLPVPVPFYQDSELMAYEFLPGQALTRGVLLGLPEAVQQSLANQLGDFLFHLHQLTDAGLPETLAPISANTWQQLAQRIHTKVFPLLLPHQRAWAEEVLHFIDDPSKFCGPVGLIHGDLAPYHILYHPLEQKLSGVIDFGVAGAGDPASDLGCLLQSYGLGFVQRMRSAYPGLNQILPRARFYAQAIELQWVLLGLESGEAFWFTAHLGAARDDLPLNLEKDRGAG